MDTYFDRIYVLNLDRRQDRWVAMKNKLTDLGLYPSSNITRFSAIDGRDPQIQALWKNAPYFLANSGVLAVLLSIQKILTDALQNKYQRFLILEDDAIFHKNFNNEWNKRVELLPKKWKLLFLGNSMHQWRFKTRCSYYPGYLTAKGTIPGAFALGIDHKAIPVLWRGILTGQSPWDLEPLKRVNDTFPGQCLVLYPPLCIAGVEDSDLRDRSLQQKAKDCNWNLSDFLS